MDIRSDYPYPLNALSNFAPHTFQFRGVTCHSMEGLLQSFKFQNPEEQKEVCLLAGKAAKQKGLEQDWRKTQTLWWQGNPVRRDSVEYQQMLDEAFKCLFSQSTEARKALLATGNAMLQHSIGVTDPKETILTTQEFCSRLMKIRTEMVPEHRPPSNRR